MLPSMLRPCLSPLPSPAWEAKQGMGCQGFVGRQGSRSMLPLPLETSTDHAQAREAEDAADPPSRVPSRCSCTHREVASLPQQAGLTSCALKASSLCGGRCVARRVPGCKQRLGDAGLNGRNGDRAGLQPSQCHEGWHKKRRSARALHCTPPPLYPAHPWHSPGSPSRSPSGL